MCAGDFQVKPRLARYLSTVFFFFSGVLDVNGIHVSTDDVTEHL